MLAQIEGGGYAAQTCANDDDVCHKTPQLMDALAGAPHIAKVEQWYQE